MDPETSSNSQYGRRDFFRTATAAAIGAIGASAVGARADAPEPLHTTIAKAGEIPPRKFKDVVGLTTKPLETVRIGIIGVGARGGTHLHTLLNLAKVDPERKVEIAAICDIDKAATERAASAVEKATGKKPQTFTNGENDFQNLCKLDNLDVVYVITPWEWHVPMALCAMDHGKHAIIEVPCAVTVAECWELVNKAEETRLHCMMTENCTYGSEEMMVLNMVRNGLLGELIHGEGAYLHNLRSILASGKSEGTWRWKHHVNRNGNTYPTHGLGPITQYMSIGRTEDQFASIVSVSSKERSLSLYVEDHGAADNPIKKAKFTGGDMNISILKTVAGRTIMVQHDVVNPRPYDRLNLISGTKGAFCGYPSRVFVDGQKEDEWQQGDDVLLFKEYQHPLWKSIGEAAKKSGGHGGMDFIMTYRLIECLNKGLPLDINVYESVAWSAVSELSELSVANGGAPVVFPDFTRGAWKTAAPLGIVG